MNEIDIIDILCLWSVVLFVDLGIICTFVRIANNSDK